MPCAYRGAWYGPDHEAGIPVGTEVNFDREDPGRFQYASVGSHSTYFPAVEFDADDTSNGYAHNNPDYVANNTQGNQPDPCDFHLNMVAMRADGEGDSIVWTPAKVYTALGHYFPPAEAVIFTVLIDHHILRGTAERPSRYDTYWDGYQFTVPFTGDRWRFSCNRAIGNDWWIQFVEPTQ